MTIDKTIVTSMAEKYRLAERMVFAKLAPWKQAAVTEDRKTGHDSGLLQQFCKDVIEMAEKMETAPVGAVPPKATPKIETASKKPVKKTKNAIPPEPPDWHKFNGANGNDGDTDLL